MHLASLGERIPAQWPALDFDAWADDLTAICGRFHPLRRERRDRVRGGAMRFDAGGLAVAQVANDLDLIHRDPADIRVDQCDNLFLLLQLQGSCGIEQSGRQQQLHPGDCILVDAARPSTFHFDGAFSNHLSVHLPRQFLLSERTARIALTHKIGADDPMSAVLGGMVAKLLKTARSDGRAPQLRELLLNATRQAFAPTDGDDVFVRADTSEGRLEIVYALIDEHLTEDYLSAQWLADRVGVSLRTLQDDMQGQGTTVTGMIKLKRLQLARAKLEHLRGARHPGAIADVALSVGFNDISYFNRCFRRQFDCAPKDVAFG
jgi:AraC-like DNA-binding protein